MNQQPPRLAKALLRQFCHVSFIEEVEGDLDEQFAENVQDKGIFRAQTEYWVDVIRAVASGNRSSRNTTDSRISFTDSISHFFKIFFRSLKHGRTSAFINMAGLVLSLVSFIAIWLYVNDELSYDTFHADAGKIYRISHSFSRMVDGAEETDARLPGVWVEALSNETAIAAHTRFSKFGYAGSVSYPKGDKLFEEPMVFWADTSYTTIFHLDLIKGTDAEQVLKDPSRVIITASIAAKYFGDNDPLGEEIIYSRGGMDFPLIVAAVVKDYPSSSHIHPAFIVNNRALDPLWARDGDDRINSNGDAFTYSFIKLNDESDLPEVVAAIEPIVRRNGDPSVKAVFTKLTDIHFTQGFLVELETPADKMYVYIAASVGILILVIAGINYMNLATARSLRRSKEVGLRKTLGVRRVSLVSQFIGESIMMMLISFLIAIALAGLGLPFFNQLLGKSFTIASLFENNTLVILVMVVLVLGILAGSYPAFYLSRFKPVDVLKGKAVSGSAPENFRKVLVVFQFSITMVLIICAVIIQSQLSFIQQGKLASHTNQVITLKTGGDITTFRNLVVQNKNIVDVSLSDHMPRQENFGFITHPFIIKSKGEEQFMLDMLKADERFVPMFGLELIAGRNFSYASPGDQLNVIVNEAALKSLRFTPEEALGQEIGMARGYDDMEQIPVGKIIGVVRDFPYNSVRQSISPLVISGYHKATETMNLKIEAGKINETIGEIESAWKKMYPGFAFQYWFMDQEFERMYTSELRMAKLSNYFTAFTIVIACLGLFGLASFTAEQKTKEIGIRKVLGASTTQILLMLTNRFVVLVLVSCVVAVPLSMYSMNLWLQSFAYRTSMHWSVFAGAGLFILLLTYLTVGIESLRAANANPVESIRHE